MKQFAKSTMELETALDMENQLELLDKNQTEVKRFIAAFIEKVMSQRRYNADASKVHKDTSKLAKKKVEGEKIKKLALRDVSKIPKHRQICYCQCQQHPLVNNCINCGKVVCELEGEGPCLFCGAWVDRESTYDLSEIYDFDDKEKENEDASILNIKYQEALRHRNRLIQFDNDAIARLKVLDEKADWWAMEKNPWLSNAEREYAKQMKKVEEDRSKEIDKKMNVNINLDTMMTNLVIDEQD